MRILIHLIITLKLENYHYGMMIFGFVFISIFLMLWMKTLASRSWAKGKFPQFLKGSDENLIEAYSTLGALMLSIDRETTGDKVDYMLHYFARHFRIAVNTQREDIIYAMRNQVTPRSVTNWVNKRFPNKKKRSSIINFLLEVGMVDGSLTKNERTFVKMVNGYLELSPSLVDELISKVDAENRRQHKSAQKRVIRPRINGAHKILGISPSATDDEIKKAYRTLVKKHHPDNFANASASEIEKAEERFIEIQKAYESLSN